MNSIAKRMYERIMKHTANVITTARILLSLLLMVFVPFSIPFYIFYILCGLTDMFDGFIARKTQTESKFGEKFDTIADIVFIIVCFIKILPVVKIEKWICIWIVVIAIIKVTNIISGYIDQGQFVPKHTIANKLTGVLLFLFPLSICSVKGSYIEVSICVVSTFAAIQEGHIIRTES